MLSSFEAGDGTLITTEYGTDKTMEQALISGIAFNRDEAQLTINGVSDTPGVAYQILGPISDADIEVDMIVQNVGADGTTDFTFTVHRNDFDTALESLEQTAKRMKAREVSGNNRIVKISLLCRYALACRYSESNVRNSGYGRHQYSDDFDFRN